MSNILGVAIRYGGKIYKLSSPNRHHNVMRMIASENGVGVQGPSKEGFYSGNKSFISRKKAMQIAIQTGQLKVRKPGEYSGDELFSEDLW